MTRKEAIRAKALIAFAAPYQLPADDLRHYVVRPLTESIADIALAKWAADRLPARRGESK